MPGRQVQLRTVQDGRKPSNSRAKRVNSGEIKNKKQQTSGESVPETMDPPRRFSSSTPSLQGSPFTLHGFVVPQSVCYACVLILVFIIIQLPRAPFQWNKCLQAIQ